MRLHGDHRCVQLLRTGAHYGVAPCAGNARATTCDCIVITVVMKKWSGLALGALPRVCYHGILSADAQAERAFAAIRSCALLCKRNMRWMSLADIVKLRLRWSTCHILLMISLCDA